MSAQQVRVWQAIFRDFLVMGVATFMLVYASAFDPTHNLYVIGGGITLLGVPAAIRLDGIRRRKEDHDLYDKPGDSFHD